MRARVGAALLGTLLGWAAVATSLHAATASLLDAGRPGQPASLNDLVGMAAALLGQAVLGWLALALIAELVALYRATGGVRPAPIPGRAGALRSPRWWRPSAARRVAAVLLGVSLAVPGSTALAAEPDRPGPAPARSLPLDWTADRPAEHPDRPTDRPDRSAERPDRPRLRAPVLTGWTPDRPARSSVARPPELRLVSGAPRSLSRAEPAQVVVHRGDTLWDLAARHLGPGAGPAEVAREWPRWYAANAAVIGPDPDLLLPGQRLRVPEPDADVPHPDADVPDADVPDADRPEGPDDPEGAP